MRKNIIMTLATAGAAALVITGCSDDSGTSHEEHSAGSSQAYEEVNQADVDYARGMIVHHEQAVEMSDIILDKSGVDPDVEALAQRIKKAQGPEIKEMETWLEDWGEDTTGHGGHGDSGGDEEEHEGMLSPEDIDKLDEADGERGSTLFLDQMIEHHQGAVKMAQEHKKDGENSDAVELSTTIIKDQKAEIAEMREMRNSL